MKKTPNKASKDGLHRSFTPRVGTWTEEDRDAWIDKQNAMSPKAYADKEMRSINFLNRLA